jgi:tetratricopeptide (TPR) repeat protein
MAMFEELLKETDKAGYSFLSAKLLAEIACCLSKLEQSDKAVEYYQRADALLESAPCNPAKNVILANLGNIWLERGEYDKALDAYRQASDMADAAGDQFARARWMKNLAVAYRESGDTHRSKQEALRAAGLFRLCGDIKSAEGCEKLCEKRAGLSK